MSRDPDATTDCLLTRVDRIRLEATRQLDQSRRGRMGQFLTPTAVARLMASMIKPERKTVRLLDAGAGVGSLAAAYVERVCNLTRRPSELEVVAYEIDAGLAAHLAHVLDMCRAQCERSGVSMSYDVHREDFIQAGTWMLDGALFSQSQKRGFDLAILNPPYGKIRSDSAERRLLRRIGIEAVNLYAGFLAIVVKLLTPGGQLVAITPRSFCNGPYFRPFRRLLLHQMALKRIHVFETRTEAFRDDKVLQEHVVFHAVKGADTKGRVVVSTSQNADQPSSSRRTAQYSEVVRPNDPDFFIHLLTSDADAQVAYRMEALHHGLDDLDISVSTGRVVDFRATEFLRQEPDQGTVPLIYPLHFSDGTVMWPRNGARKPNAIVASPETADLLVPAGVYVLVKRFSAKEERRRVVAAVHDPARVPSPWFGFENHLNYYHRDGGGLPSDLAKGLAIFLNSTILDRYFRLFSGHTQVNATDLRRLRYPSAEALVSMGKRSNPVKTTQEAIDLLVEECLLN